MTEQDQKRDGESMDRAWQTLYQAATHHGDVSERMYSCLGRMLTIRQQAPERLDLIAECENTMSFLVEQSAAAKAAMEEARGRYDQAVRDGGRMPILLAGDSKIVRN